MMPLSPIKSVISYSRSVADDATKPAMGLRLLAHLDGRNAWGRLLISSPTIPAQEFKFPSEPSVLSSRFWGATSQP